MKGLFFVLVFGLCVPALSANGQEGRATQRKPAVAQAPGASGGYWCRAANGGRVWVSPATDGGKTARENPQRKQASGGTRVYSYYRPTVVTSYPDSFRPDVVNGVDWYLNGRSYFSD